MWSVPPVSMSSVGIARGPPNSKRRWRGAARAAAPYSTSA
jgi:hypothetical protein